MVRAGAFGALVSVVVAMYLGRARGLPPRRLMHESDVEATGGRASGWFFVDENGNDESGSDDEAPCQKVPLSVLYFVHILQMT